MKTKPNGFPSRCFLKDVPRVNFYEVGPRCPEDIPLPSVMRALGEYLGDDKFGCRTCRGTKPGCKIDCSYAFFVGVTGAASYLSWKKGWHEDNMALFYMSDDPEAPERWALRALGYEHQWIERGGGEDTLLDSDHSHYRQAIIESINMGKPVIGYGVVGPPEPVIVTGYDEDGEVLVGWSFFQNSPEFNQGVSFGDDGQFHKRDWFKDTHSLLVIGEKTERPELAAIYQDALTWAVNVTRTPLVRPEQDAPEWYRERANGLAAYDAWVDQLLTDEEFPADEEEVLRKRHEIHHATVGVLAEARWYGSLFLIQSSDPDILHFRKTEHLLHAAACYAAEHDLMWKVWDLAGGISNPEAWKLFADPNVRRQMVPVIQKAKEKDTQAIAHIESALEG